MKLPNWTESELILALDLYFSKGYSRLSNNHIEIIQLSDIIRNFPIYRNKNYPNSFRSPSSIYMKLGNFTRIDPNYPGKGLDSGSKLEIVVWDRYANNKEQLHSIANQIRKFAGAQQDEFTQYPNEDFGAPEGDWIFKVHKHRERNPSLSKKKKKNFISIHGCLFCEVCGFDFEKQYAGIEKPFIECHHIRPLATLKPNQITRLSDLILVCPNCHRMLHRMSDPSDIDMFKKRINYKFNKNILTNF